MNSLFMRLYHAKKCMPEDERRWDRLYSAGLRSMLYVCACSVLVTKVLLQSNVIRVKIRPLAYFGGVLAVGSVNIVRLAVQVDALLEKLDGKYQQLGYE